MQRYKSQSKKDRKSLCAHGQALSRGENYVSLGANFMNYESLMNSLLLAVVHIHIAFFSIVSLLLLYTFYFYFFSSTLPERTVDIVISSSTVKLASGRVGAFF